LFDVDLVTPPGANLFDLLLKAWLAARRQLARGMCCTTGNQQPRQGHDTPAKWKNPVESPRILVISATGKSKTAAI
jgi:hypothetical protein